MTETDGAGFHDRVAIVTGGANGLGLACAELLLERGATVVMVDFDGDRLRAEVTRLRKAGLDCDGHEVDLADADQTDRMVAAVVERHGRIDILTNFAGITPFCRFADMTLDFWHRMLASHLDTTFNTCRVVVPHMSERGYGRIVNTSSGTVLMGFAGTAAYTAAKAGIIGFSRVLAREVGPDGITVNVLMPGLIPTEHAQTSDSSAQQAIVDRQSVPRLGEPADIAATVAFMVSAEAGFTTGQTFNVGGGINYV